MHAPSRYDDTGGELTSRRQLMPHRDHALRKCLPSFHIYLSYGSTLAALTMNQPCCSCGINGRMQGSIASYWHIGLCLGGFLLIVQARVIGLHHASDCQHARGSICFVVGTASWLCFLTTSLPKQRCMSLPRPSPPPNLEACIGWASYT